MTTHPLIKASLRRRFDEVDPGSPSDVAPPTSTARPVAALSSSKGGIVVREPMPCDTAPTGTGAASGDASLWPTASGTAAPRASGSGGPTPGVTPSGTPSSGRSNAGHENPSGTRGARWGRRFTTRCLTGSHLTPIARDPVESGRSLLLSSIRYRHSRNIGIIGHTGITVSRPQWSSFVGSPEHVHRPRSMFPPLAIEMRPTTRAGRGSHSIPRQPSCLS